MATHFDLTDMQLMVNISDSFSLTGGAEKSHLSVPAASIRVKNLEDCFHTRLLYRTNQGVTLTPAGDALMRHARAFLARADQLQDDMQKFATGVKGRIRILGNTTAMMEILPAILGRFLATHPDVDVELRESFSHRIVRAIADGTADVGVVGGRPVGNNLQFLPYRDDSLVVIVPKGHPLIGSRTVAFADTLAFDYVGLSEWSGVHSFLIQAAAELGRPFKFRAEIGNFEVVCRMVEVKVGIGVIPKSVALRYARTLNIAVIELSDSWARRRSHVCVRDLDALPLVAREFVDMFMEDLSAVPSSREESGVSARGAARGGRPVTARTAQSPQPAMPG